MTIGRKSLRQLSRRISQMCTVTSPDTLAVLESMKVAFGLCQIVKSGNFQHGLFKPGFGNPGQQSG